MANVLSNLFTDIADSIRSKTGSTEKLSPSEFASQIDSISVGGGGAEGCVTVTFMNGDNVLLTRPVYIGDDCPDPVTQGRIETPTKESTAQYNYTHSGWTSVDGGTANSSVLKNITEDKVVYAAFTETVRTFTISFYDGTTLVNIEKVNYGDSSSYVYKKENYLFNGWNPAPVNVTSDLNCYGIWEESYAFADASWEYIARMSESGRASEAFAIGDTKTIQITAKDGSVIETLIQIVGFNHDDLADGTGKAGISLITTYALHHYIFSDDYRCMCPTRFVTPNKRYLGDGGVNEFLNDTVYNSLSENLRSYIKAVTKTLCNQYSGSSTELSTVDAKIWLPGVSEITTERENTSSTNVKVDGILYEYFETAENRKKYIQTLADGVTDSYQYDGVRTAYVTRSMGYVDNSPDRAIGINCANGKAVQVSLSIVALGFCI
jgi:hypothetical protein